VHRKFRKPLICISPKNLLRLPACSSPLSAFTDSDPSGIMFQRVIGETDASVVAKNVTRLIFCSGKIYYDLFAYLEANRVSNAALLRVEQLYPLNLERLEEMISVFQHVSKWVWCQEEPRNMGAWTYIAPLLGRITRQALEYAGRPAAASPAVGSKAWHDQQQKELVHHAFSM